MFIEEDGKPIYSESSWELYIQGFRNGTYEKMLNQKKRAEGFSLFMTYWGQSYNQLIKIVHTIEIRFTKELLMREDPDRPGIIRATSANEASQTYVKVGQGFDSNGSAYRRRSELQNVLTEQGAGDPASSFLRHLEFSDKQRIAIQNLKITGRLEPEDTLDFKTNFGFTDEQIRGMKQAGLGLASFKDMKEAELKRQIRLHSTTMELEVNKAKDKEQVILREVK